MAKHVSDDGSNDNWLRDCEVPMSRPTEIIPTSSLYGGNPFANAVDNNAHVNTSHYSSYESINRNPSNRYDNQYNNRRQHQQRQQYHCQSCDRDFNGIQRLEAHTRSHISCPESGCKFSASIQVMATHASDVHGKGNDNDDAHGAVITFNIPLNTPEEIAEWRRQRRLRYPTAANIAKKTEEQKRSASRGEVATTANFTVRHGVKRQSSKQLGGSSKCGGVASNSMLSLADAYDSGSEDDVTEKAVNCSVNSEKLEGKQVQRICKFFASKGSCLRGDKCEFLHERRIGGVSKGAHNNNDKRTRKQQRDASASSKKKKNSLLSMLLAPEKRREQNVLLQCIFHIVDNEFFSH